MLAETIIICSTVLIIFAGTLWFGNRWFFTQREKAEALTIVKNVQEFVHKYHALCKEQWETLAKNDVNLAEEIKKVQIAANLVQTGKMGNLAHAMQAIRERAQP